MLHITFNLTRPTDMMFYFSCSID